MGWFKHGLISTNLSTDGLEHSYVLSYVHVFSKQGLLASLKKKEEKKHSIQQTSEEFTVV